MLKHRIIIKRFNMAQLKTTGDVKIGSQSYTQSNLTPTDISTLAFAYASSPLNKVVGKKLDHNIKVANDLAKLTGGKQLKPGMQPGNKALLVFILKDKLVTVDEYKDLYKKLVDLHKKVVTVIDKINPKGSAKAGRAASKDMKGEFDENLNESPYEKAFLQMKNSYEKRTGKPFANMSPKQKKDFFDDIDDMWKAKKESVIEISNSPGKTNVKIGDVIKFKPKWGYWDVTKYPYGGDFKRFGNNETGTVIKGTTKLPYEIRVKLKDGREIVVKHGAIETVNKKPYVDEVITEAGDEPDVITQLRGIVKDKQYKSVKDPITSKKVKVDMTSAHVITMVYDKLSPKNQQEYVTKSIPTMAKIAFKLIK